MADMTKAATESAAASNAWGKFKSATPETPAAPEKPKAPEKTTAGKGSSRKPRKTDEGDIKTARTTFICTPEKWVQLQALCTYYTITGQTIDGNRPTPNRLLNVAIDAYLKDHAADLEQYKAITGKLQKGKTAKK